MPSTNTVSKPVQTVGKFTQDMQTFIANVKKVVTRDEQGRTKFPDFIVTDVIKEKVSAATESLKEGDLAKAFSWLEDVRKHFQNQQASWAKNLKQDLVEDLLALATAKCAEDLLAPARKAVGEYEVLMNERFFDLDEASKRYWTAIDKLNFAEDMWKRRLKNAPRRAEQKAKRAGQPVPILPVKDPAEEARKREEELQQQHLQECAEAANQLEQLVESF